MHKPRMPVLAHVRAWLALILLTVQAVAPFTHAFAHLHHGVAAGQGAVALSAAADACCPEHPPADAAGEPAASEPPCPVCHAIALAGAIDLPAGPPAGVDACGAAPAPSIPVDPPARQAPDIRCGSARGPPTI